ncbi:MAG: hypothetical protein ACTSUE_09140 [Promethearchaeota archaeon]
MSDSDLDGRTDQEKKRIKIKKKKKKQKKKKKKQQKDKKNTKKKNVTFSDDVVDIEGDTEYQAKRKAAFLMRQLKLHVKKKEQRKKQLESLKPIVNIPKNSLEYLLHERSCCTDTCEYHYNPSTQEFICKDYGISHICDHTCKLRTTVSNQKVCPRSGKVKSTLDVGISYDEVFESQFELEIPPETDEKAMQKFNQDEEKVVRNDNVPEFSADSDPFHANGGGKDAEVYQQVQSIVTTLLSPYIYVDKTDKRRKLKRLLQHASPQLGSNSTDTVHHKAKELVLLMLDTCDAEAYTNEIAELWKFTKEYAQCPLDITTHTIGVLYLSIHGLSYGRAIAIPRDDRLNMILPNVELLERFGYDRGACTSGKNAIEGAYEEWLSEILPTNSPVTRSVGKLGASIQTKTSEILFNLERHSPNLYSSSVSPVSPTLTPKQQRKLNQEQKHRILYSPGLSSKILTQTALKYYISDHKEAKEKLKTKQQKIENELISLCTSRRRM